MEKVACIGGGIIGSSWALLFSKEGCRVNVYDLDSHALERSEGRIRDWFVPLIDKGVVSILDVEEALKRIVFTSDLEEALNEVDFVQESSVENLKMKQELFREIDRYNKEAIVSSSTSGLRISDIVEYCKHRNRYIGGHPYNPPHLVPLVEITRGNDTDDGTVQVAKAFYRRVKKEPVVLLKESVGFIGNRLQVAYMREVINMVLKGIATLEDIDKASVFGPGLRGAIIGPMLTNELNGGEEGIAGFYKKFGHSIEATLNDDFASWQILPKDFIEKIGPEEVKKEVSNRSQETGNSVEEIIKFRDGMLIELLKLHNKV